MNRKKIVRPDNLEPLDYPVGDMTKRQVMNKIIEWCNVRKIVKHDLGKYVGIDIIDKAYITSIFKEALLKIMNKYKDDKEVTLFHLVNGTRMAAKNLIINQLIAIDRRESEFGNNFSEVKDTSCIVDGILDIAEVKERALMDHIEDIKRNLQKEGVAVHIPCTGRNIEVYKKFLGNIEEDGKVSYRKINQAIKRLRNKYAMITSDEKELLSKLLNIEDGLVESWLDKALRNNH